MWLDEKHRAFKLHTHFELLKGVPVRMDLTDGNGNEREVLEAHLQPDRVYVMDRGYAKFALFQADSRGRFVLRLPHAATTACSRSSRSGSCRERPWMRGSSGMRWCASPASQAIEAGLNRPLRIVEIECTPHRKATGHTGRGGPEQGDTILIATDLLDVPPEMIALIYKHRWAIETFFRFFKHVLGCRHLLSHSTNGIRIQVYLAIIACLLIALWTGASRPCAPMR